MSKFGKIMTDGLFIKNPIFIQMLGLCSSLAVTTTFVNALGMGAAVTVILTFSNILISLLKNFIPNQVRIACYIVIISGFVTAVEMIMKAYFYDLSKTLGLFIPLIVVNCIILARAESFASKNGVLSSAIDGIASGLGYTLAIAMLSFLRELLGSGTIFAGTSFAIKIPGFSDNPILFMVSSSGAFVTLGVLTALFNFIISKVTGKGEKKHD